MSAFSVAGSEDAAALESEAELESHIVRVWRVQSDSLKGVVHCGKRML